MFKCAICGKEFKDEDVLLYGDHVAKCAMNKKKDMDAVKKAKDEEELKKANEALENLKKAKAIYEGLDKEFKKNYPDLYKANFQKDFDPNNYCMNDIECDGKCNNCKCTGCNDVNNDWGAYVNDKDREDFNTMLAEAASEALAEIFGVDVKYKKR